MTSQKNVPGLWSRLPVSLRAVVSGFLIVLIPINVWPVLLFKLGAPAATLVEAIFLGLYVWWAAGGGPPRITQAARATAFRRGGLSPKQWFWGGLGALAFAVTVHSRDCFAVPVCGLSGRCVPSRL